MQSKLFHPHTLEDAKHAAVGDCNGLNMETRWNEETPIFVEAILKYKNDAKIILDYGCGAGRLAKELLKKSDELNLGLKVLGIDNSSEMLDLASKDINHKDFFPLKPEELKTKVDFVYLIYCLQHIPAVEIRDVLQRIYTFLSDEGKLFYCSSDYRMAIRFDNPGFFDDRFLGVNLQEELSRFFIKVCNVFSEEELENYPVVKKMIKGDLSHPAIIYRKKKKSDYLFNAGTENEEMFESIFSIQEEKKSKESVKLILKNPLSPGDILVMTSAIRALHKAYPEKFKTDVRSPAPEIFFNSPYISHLDDQDSEVRIIEMQYPEIHSSGESGKHFSDGHRIFLSKELGIPIPQAGITPDIFLNQDEIFWTNPLTLEHGYKEKYWIVNAGSKSDYTLKQYFYYQEVINLLKNKIIFVQIGQKEHKHTQLGGVFDMLGKTPSLRQLFRLIYHAEGILTCVSLPLHVAAAFKKPCVCVALGREGPRWEFYPNQRFLHTTGCLKCCSWDGCWKNKLEDCLNLVEDKKNGKVPKCQKLITPEQIVEAVMMYYNGDILIS
jgi:ADP-heptose:LPS heptosyltransferase/SAM-dependent methyltransferase